MRKLSERGVKWIFTGGVGGILVAAEVAIRSGYSSTGMVAGLLFCMGILAIGFFTEPDK